MSCNNCGTENDAFSGEWGQSGLCNDCWGSIPLYDSMVNALANLGLGQPFRYTTNNLDGVPSTNSNIHYTNND